MSVERSARGVLTTNADYKNSYEYSTYVRQSTSNQWGIVDNYTIYSQNSGNGSFSDEVRRLQYIVWNGYSGLNYDLEYSIVIKEFNSSNVLFESGWLPNNEICHCYGFWDSETRRPSFTLYVRRNEFDSDGNRRTLVPSDMRPSYFQTVWKVNQDIEQQTNPASWYETTTQSIPTYTTQTTMLTTVDYEGYLSTLTIPVDVRPAIATLDQLINDLWTLHYIPFVVCFALIMGLAIWLLH